MIDPKLEEDVRSRLARIAEAGDGGATSVQPCTESTSKGRRFQAWPVATAALVAVVVGLGAVVLVNRPGTDAADVAAVASEPSSRTVSSDTTALAAASENCVEAAPAPGKAGEPSAEDMAKLSDPSTKFGVEDAKGRVVGYVAQSQLRPQPGDTTPDQIEARMESLIPVVDLCSKQVGWLSFQGLHFFTLEEVAAPGFDTMTELKRLGIV